MLASTFYLQDRLEEALAAYSRTLELLPNDTSTLVNRGEIYLKLGKFPEASADLKRAFDLGKDQPDPYSNRALLLLQMTSKSLKLALEKGPEALLETKDQILNDFR